MLLRGVNLDNDEMFKATTEVLTDKIMPVFWLGGTDSREGEWEWQDGSAWGGFTAWWGGTERRDGCLGVYRGEANRTLTTPQTGHLGFWAKGAWRAVECQE